YWVCCALWDRTLFDARDRARNSERFIGSVDSIGEAMNQQSIYRRIFSTDHKTIGKQYLFTSLFFLFFGGALAMMMRLQLGWPGHPFPFLNWIFSQRVVAEGVIMPDFYNALFTMHATFMIFF